MPTLTTWRSLSIAASTPIFKSSVAILIAVPLLARLSAAAVHAGNWFAVLREILDASVIEIPPNLLRLFWGSMMMTIVQLLYRMRCPPILRLYMDFSDWDKHAEEATDLRRKLTKEHGDENQVNIVRSMREHYDRETASATRSDPLVRCLILLLYFASGYLALRVLAEQIAIVWRFTDLRALF